LKRRHAIQTILGIPAAAALISAAPQAPPASATRPDELKLPVAAADITGPGTPRFFTVQQFSALRHLAEIIAPATEETPGAVQAGAAEFLDFLIGSSPQDRSKLYRNGLDRLNADAHRRYQKAFAELSTQQVDVILVPLHEPWNYNAPSDPFAQFLLAAKQDVLTATVNSREWIQATSGRRRNAGGMGMYWFPIE
jgi:Gluconate 2-dehydrogenase subunit 3